MIIKSDVKAGGKSANHNETIVVRSEVKAGGILKNHNESVR